MAGECFVVLVSGVDVDEERRVCWMLMKVKNGGGC